MYSPSLLSPKGAICAGFAGKQIRCKTRSFIGTTTTGSSLVHCKLYWVPARAALRLGTSDRCCNRQLHSKSWKLSRGRNERTLQRGLLATVSAEKNKNVLTYLLTGFGAPARRVFPDHLITGPVIVRWIALPRRSLRSTVRRRHGRGGRLALLPPVAIAAPRAGGWWCAAGLDA